MRVYRVIRALKRISMLMLHIILGCIIVVLARIARGGQWYKADQGGDIIQWWMKHACRIVALKINVQSSISEHPGTLFVANHISWLDIIAILSQSYRCLKPDLYPRII